MIFEGPSDSVVERGNSTTFSCAAVGNGTLNITWQLPTGEAIFTGQDMEEIWSVNSSLTILDISTDDRGDYTCIAENEAGVTLVTANLSVRLYIDEPQQTVLNTRNGTTETLLCTIVGFPVSYSWEKAVYIISGSGIMSSGLDMGLMVSEVTFTKISIGQVLVFGPAVFDDEGLYRCVASGLGEEIVSDQTIVMSECIYTQ